MKCLGFNLLFICLYCFPFVYFAMYQDFSNGSMIGYFMMVILTSIIAFFAKYTKNTIAIILGNIISMGISFYFITKMQGNEPWAGYFKPLTPFQLLILVSYLNIIPQFIAVLLAKKALLAGK